MGSVGANKNTVNVTEKVNQMSNSEIGDYLKNNGLWDIYRLTYLKGDKRDFGREIVKQHMEGKLDNSPKEAVIGGDKKVSQDLQDLAKSTFNEVSKELPILKDYTTGIEFNKYMTVAGYGHQDSIELNGAYLQKRLSRKYEDDIDYVQGVIAHELVHTVQSRVSQKLGEKEEAFNERVWNNAVKKFVTDNPKYTEQQVNKGVASAYGQQGHSRAGSVPTEKMAVAIEAKYAKSGWKDLGEYVERELKSEMKKVRK